MTATIIPDNPPPAPAGATNVDGWGKSWRGQVLRLFDGTKRVVELTDDGASVNEPLSVVIDGIQYDNGRARRGIALLDSSGESLTRSVTPHDARQLGAAFIAAADECDACAGQDWATK
jgi:hypothetical protein